MQGKARTESVKAVVGQVLGLSSEKKNKSFR